MVTMLLASCGVCVRYVCSKELNIRYAYFPLGTLLCMLGATEKKMAECIATHQSHDRHLDCVRKSSMYSDGIQRVRQQREALTGHA